MSHSHQNSLHSKAVNESIIYHLFLPCYLPSSKDADYLIQYDDHQNEHEILKCMKEFLRSLDATTALPIFSVLTKCIQNWSILQNPKTLSVVNLQLTFQQLEPGDFFPLYFHAQNAAILIEMDENPSYQPLISSWQVLLSTKAITSSLIPHLSCFPAPIFRLRDRSQLTSKPHCELLIDFMNNPIEYSTSYKASYAFNETRDVLESHYVRQWWIMQFEGIKMENNVNTSSQFKKKHRDQIRWKDAKLPFRRSGLWMTIKVIFHTILIKRLKSVGTVIYKLLITHFLTYVLYTTYSDLSADILVHCLRKIARRLNKIDDLLSGVDSCYVNKWIQYGKQEIQSKMEHIISTLGWQQSIKINESNIQKLVITNLNLNDSSMYCHPCIKLKEYLNNNNSFNSNTIHSSVNNHNNSTSADINHMDYIPSISVLLIQSNNSIGIVLTRMEIWVESCLEKWIDRPILFGSRENRFETLLRFFEEYQSRALNHYYSGGNASDSIGYSRFILTSLTIIYLMHQKLCHDERFERLKFHSVVIPNLTNLFEYLILPNREDMIRARRFYDYFSQFESKQYPDLLKNIDLVDAFGVHFASRSTTMEKSLQQIRAQIKLDEQAKIQEVNQAKKQYRQLMDEANNLQCKCDEYRYIRKCKKCETIRQAEGIKVSIYERPLPSRHHSALAVIFELQMPIEIRCYREILWQFVNRPYPQPLNSMYEWLKVHPHGDKLRPYCTHPRNWHVQLVSSVKSITQSHYSTPPSIVSTPAENFLFENGLNVQISPTKLIPLEQERDILTLQLYHKDYKDLQFTVDTTEFEQNRVIAKISDCPIQLKPTHFVEFGSFRSGHHLQWWNLLSILEMESLPIDEESVAILIVHSLLQYGPVATNQNAFVSSWCSEAHRPILEDHFVDELISRLNQRLDDCIFNWQNEMVLLVITMITMRLLTLCNTTRETEVADLALKCRQVGEKWIDLISESIQITSSLVLSEGEKLREKIISIGITCLLTFSVHSDRTDSVLSSNEHIVSLLKVATTVRDNSILSKNQTNMSKFMNHMLRFSERVLVAIQPSVTELIEKTSYISLNEFSAIYWAVITGEGTMDGKWKKRTTDVYDGWYDGRYQSAQISIDCLSGTFLVNNMTIGFLPQKITSNELFVRVFDHHIFEVQAGESPNTYVTKHSYHGSKVQYDFHFNDQINHLTIHERHIGTKDLFQLISHKCFETELPEALVSNYSHWRNTKNENIEFRPVHFKDDNFLNDKTYILIKKTGYVVTTDKTQILVNQSSPFFDNLLKRYFIRLDDGPYVYMMRDNALDIIENTPPKDDVIIHIHLSRLGIAFKYNASTNVIISNEYSDMCIAEDQWLGTLTGLQFGILLSPTTPNNTECERYQCRKLIVPFGKILAEKKQHSNHQFVKIQRTSFTHQYFVFNLNDRLKTIQSTDSPAGWLYLALLHAITSHPLPDQYTGMTGMERSFQLLKSAGCWNDQPYDALSLDILYQIATISPKVNYYPPYLTCMQKIEWKSQSLHYSMQHFGYYLIVKKLIDTSQQLTFMYPSSDTKAAPEFPEKDQNNEKLLKKLYWDYRDSYNPIARLSEEMEAEILSANSTEQYQLNSPHCGDVTNSSCIKLVDDLYKSGSINLKDTQELNCFPLSKWLSTEYELKNIWIGLLKIANCLNKGNNREEIQRFEILLDFLHYISAKTHNQCFYLQMLRTVLKVPIKSLESITFLPFGQYDSIEEVSVRKERIQFAWNQTLDERNLITAEIERCFIYDSIYVYINAQPTYFDTTHINTLLKRWRANQKLRSFLEFVQSGICSVPVKPLDTKISVHAQQFTLESVDVHYRIKLKQAEKSINPELISSAQQKFSHCSSIELIKSTKSVNTIHPQHIFPDQIFPSDDNHVNPLSDIANHFKKQLGNSWEKLLAVRQDQKEYPSVKKIKQFLELSRKESAEFWKELITSIILSNELLFETGVISRITPSTLISIFLKIWLNKREQQDIDASNFDIVLTTDQCILLGGAIVNWIFEQQLERALHFERNEKREDFEKELSNRPHANWKPIDHLPWLIMELEMNITIREIQVEVAYLMMQSNTTLDKTGIQNIVMQMNMGEGKTSVIIPMLALSLCSSSSSLVRIVVLKSLFTINYQSLRFKLGGLLNRRIFPFACRRNMNFNYTQLNEIFRRFQQGLKMCDVILTSPEYILSFDLLTIDKCRQTQFDIGRLMLNMQRWLKTHARDVLDESDEILHVKYQLIYTIGGQQQIDGGAERWKIIQSVLQLVKKHAAGIKLLYDDTVCYQSSEQKSRFPHFRLLTIRPFLILCKNIADDWLHERTYRQAEQQLISSFILDSDQSLQSLNGKFSPNNIQLFLILRGLLSSEVLFVALKKRYRVNFGVNENLQFNRLMAVPFRAKDVAAENTEFGHPDVAIVLTQLSYYYSGLKDSQLCRCFERLSQEENDPALIYEEWISYDDLDRVDASIRKWNGVNLKDYQQRTRHLFPTLRYNMLTINYFLNHFVFPREAKQFPHKLIGSAWDLSSPDRSKVITGFSGTNDTQLLLPVHIRQFDLPQLQKTDAVVVNNLLQRENENYNYFSIDVTSAEILKQIVNYKSHIQVILDVGALFIDGTNCEIAVEWLKLSDKSKIDYAVYFESDFIYACDRQFRHYAFLTSPASQRLDRCVIYLDDIHTRGSDFKFPKGFRAAVTLGHGLTKDRLVQAAMRMRQLGNGHSLTFWSSNEVHQQIQKLKEDSTRKNRKRNFNKHADQITLLDILRWVYENTQQATWDGLHHWAAQSINFQRKIAAFRNIQWKNLHQPFTTTLIQELGRDCLEPEVMELTRMYGASKQLQTVFVIYSVRYRQSKIQFLTKIHKDILKQLETYGGSKKRLAQLLDEEQERELEQELEEERQVERPPAVLPCQPILHDEIIRLCDTQGDMLNLNQLTGVFRPLVYAFTDTTFFNDCQPNCWRQNLWISTEFQRVIETKGESLNPFLRPSRWIVVYRNQHLIFVSPFEANWLMNQLNSLHRTPQPNSAPITTLRLLLPRTKRRQLILVDTPTLIIPYTITPAFVIPLKWLIELFMFNGTLYFKDNHEQKAYCEYLGVCPKPRTPIEEQAFEKGLIAADGFVCKPQHGRHSQVHECRFNSSPLSLVKMIIENRNNSHAPLISHVGSIIFNSLKLI